MKAGFFLGALMVLATFAALAPSASANHDCLPAANTYPCIRAGSFSFGDGDCDASGYGGQQNYASVNTGNTPAGFIGASASTYCYQSGNNAYNSLSAGVYKSGGAGGFTSAGAAWYDYDYTFFQYCYSYAYVYTGGQYTFEELPLCDLGAPPEVPAVL